MGDQRVPFGPGIFLKSSETNTARDRFSGFYLNFTKRQPNLKLAPYSPNLHCPLKELSQVLFCLVVPVRCGIETRADNADVEIRETRVYLVP
jgi:hypothetical protein